MKKLSYVILVLLLIGTVSAATWTEGLSVDLRAYYKLDESSGTIIEDSVYGINGTSINGNQNSGGKIGYGYNQSATDISSEILVNLSGSTTGSFNVWIKRTGDFAETTLLSNENDDVVDPGGVRIWTQQTNKVYLMGVEDDSTQVLQPHTLSLNSWTMYTLTIGDNITMYANGESFYSIVHDPLSIKNNNFFIFSDIDGDKTGISSRIIDELSIWNRTLTAAEVTLLYNADAGMQYEPEVLNGSLIGVELLNPANNTNILVDNQNFSAVHNTTGFTLDNTTLRIYDSSMNAFKKDEWNFTESFGSTNTTNLSFSGFDITERYYWDFFTCASNDTDTSCGASDTTYTFRYGLADLFLDFRSYWDDLNATSGYWVDNNGTTTFHTTSLNMDLLEADLGIVKCYFNNYSSNNFTQFYEFENTWVSGTTENVSLIYGTIDLLYIKVRDYNGDPISDALIKMAYSDPDLGSDFKFIGQRLTGSEGISGVTYFYVPNDVEIQMIVSADGYERRVIPLPIKTDEYNSLNPYIIDLKRSVNNVYKGISVELPTYYNQNTTSITMTTYAPSRSSGKFTTSFSGENFTINFDDFEVGVSTLLPNTHYCSDCENNLTIDVWIDNVWYNNYTITYKAIDTSKFVSPSGLNKDIFMKVAWIFLILIVGTIGILIKEGEESVGSGRFGKPMFLIGCLIMSILFVGEFGVLLAVVVFYGAGTIIRRWISE